MITVSCVPALEDNYIWLLGHTGSHAVAIVDPGEVQPVLAAVAHQHWEPAAILLTHHHADHTAGAAELAGRFDIPVYGPEDTRIPAVTRPVHDGTRVQLDALGLTLTVMATPGHTRSHVCYAGPDVLFCGDTLFTAGCGRLFEGTPQQMHASLSRLNALPEATLVYCAHEYTEANLRFALVVEPDNPAIQARLATVMAQRSQGKPTVPAPLVLERQTNPFLRTADPVVVAAAERFAGRPLAHGAEVFGTLRQWKDTLD